jgi:hypothetical protein
MPAASDVTPERWSDISVLFDDGEYSVISGTFRGDNGDSYRRLGERWNGHEGKMLGFPNVAGYPVWHVVPEFLALPVLHGLLDEIARTADLSSKFTKAILRELSTRQRT